TVGLVREGTRLARECQADVVVGIGGGSALDAAKAVAILATAPGDVLDYLEVVGAGKNLDRPGIPMVAIPTTAGTGAEVTRNSVLASPEHGVKVSLRSPHLLPRLAIVDPHLSSDMPPDLTARVGCDALTQLIEPFVSTRAHPLTDAVCREGLRLAAPALRTVFRHGSDLGAREAMAEAALLSGMALANAGLGVVHGLAGPIGGVIPAPHGSICAALLPFGMEVNLRTLRQRMPDSDALRRFEELGPLLTGRGASTADDAVAWVASLVADLGIPRLSAFGLSGQMLPTVVQRATVASSTRTNPIVLTEGELTEILERAL
ncbi:MAG TPA: iron-containing alcohol dehydrogenase, partial [Dongiaceae bacterium]|nr:iron-containing alcohol dehydrogenase [Dongiaceae bacterium]